MSTKPNNKKTDTVANIVTSTHANEHKSLYTAQELYDREIDKIPMFWSLGIPRTGIATLAGSSDTGKSCFLRTLSIATANQDTSFLGYELNSRQKGVIYVSTEDNDDAFSVLVKRHCKIQNKEGLNSMKVLFDSSNYVSELGKLLIQYPSCLVVIDALTDIFKGDMNRTNEIRGFMDCFKSLASKHDCVIIFLHHIGKQSETKKPSKRGLLGSQGIEAKSRAVFELRRDPADNNIRHLCVLKGNYIDDNLKEKSVELEFHKDSLTFSNTGKRVSMDKIFEGAENPNLELKQLAQKLKRSNPELKNSEIIRELDKKGFGKVPKSTISDWLKELEN